MEDKELIEKWRNQFHEINRYRNISHDTEGRYFDGGTHRMFMGFLQAKRNMPVVEITRPTASDGFKYWQEVEVIEALDLAGIQYRIKD